MREDLRGISMSDHMLLNVDFDTHFGKLLLFLVNVDSSPGKWEVGSREEKYI